MDHGFYSANLTRPSSHLVTVGYLLAQRGKVEEEEEEEEEEFIYHK